MSGMPDADLERREPWGWLRRWLAGWWFYVTARFLFRLYATVVHGLRTRGVANVPREGGLVVAVNHFSTLDPPMMGVTMPREISFMAKRELFERPPVRAFVEGLHAFPVDRERSDLAAIKEASRRLKAGRAVGVFVQGTRDSADAEALDGAAFLAQRTGAPLQPAAVWREGRRYVVAYGEPFDVPGRGKVAMREGTRETVARINALLPSSTQMLAPPALAAEGGGDAPTPPGSDPERTAQETPS